MANSPWRKHRTPGYGGAGIQPAERPPQDPEPAPILRRELGLRDLTLFVTACIVGTRWIPAAAHAGPGSITLWLLAAVLFMVPLAFAVAVLAVKYPGAGGFYLWTRNDFGHWNGFLCFWSYWVAIAFWFPSAAMFYMSAGISALGPRYAHLAQDRLVLVAVALVAIWVALGTNLIGMKIGKWTENLGALAAWAVGVTLVAVAAVMGSRHGSATPIDIRPTWNWDTVNSWANFAYAMSGLEMAGVMNAEIRDPERTLPRAGWIASAFAFVFYASATIAMLVILRPEQTSEMNGFGEAATAASHAIGAAWLMPVIAILVLLSAVGQFGGLGTGVSRLPFAVGVDHLLPKAFARVHPRWGTPHLSILLLAVVASLLLITMQAGDTMAAAYQSLVSLMVITGFFPYIYIFGSAWKAGRRLSALSGWAVTVMAIVCAAVPTTAVSHVWVFEGKLAAGTFAVIASAWLLFRRAQSKA
jgi:glutamate:GABA antiporter